MICKKPVEMEQNFMKPKSPSPHKQGHLLYPDLLTQLNPKAPLLCEAKDTLIKTSLRFFVSPFYF